MDMEDREEQVISCMALIAKVIKRELKDDDWDVEEVEVSYSTEKEWEVAVVYRGDKVFGCASALDECYETVRTKVWDIFSSTAEFR